MEPSPTSVVRGAVTGNGLGRLPRLRYASINVRPRAADSGTPKKANRTRRTHRMTRPASLVTSTM